MGKIMAWFRRHVGQSQPGYANQLIEASLANYAQAEDFLAHFRSGQQAGLQDLMSACLICGEDIQDVIRDHNQSLQNRRHSAA